MNKIYYVKKYLGTLDIWCWWPDLAPHEVSPRGEDKSKQRILWIVCVLSSGAIKDCGLAPTGVKSRRGLKSIKKYLGQP